MDEEHTTPPRRPNRIDPIAGELKSTHPTTLYTFPTMQDALTLAFNTVSLISLTYFSAMFISGLFTRPAAPTLEDADRHAAEMNLDLPDTVPTPTFEDDDFDYTPEQVQAWNAAHNADVPAPSTSATPIDTVPSSFESQPIRELKKVAKSFRIKNYSRLNKAELSRQLTAQLA